MERYKVLFAPSLKEIAQEEGKTILDAAREAGVYIDSQCNGKGKCGKCRVRVVEGKAGPFTQEESEFISQTDRGLGYRLACMTRVTGDVTVLIAQENILSSDSAKKLFSGRSSVLNPAVKSYVVDLPEEEGPQTAYFERITGLLKARWGLGGLSVDLLVLQGLGEVMKEASGKATVFVWMDKEIISVRPGEDETCLGLALDVGTTTVALYLCDLKSGDIKASASTTNPQVLFGTDIMSRISYSSHHPGQGVKRMQGELGAGGKRPDRADERAQRLLTPSDNGHDGRGKHGNAPHLSRHSPRLIWVSGLSARRSRGRWTRRSASWASPSTLLPMPTSLPVEAGFVGADNVAVLLSEEPYNRDEIALIIDLGTNGELVLGNREELLSCSCATGPALEGAHIVSGMRATNGAIEKVRIDPVTYDVDYGVIGIDGWASQHEAGTLKPVGLCGSGIIDTVAHLFMTGIIGEDGAFKANGKTERLRKGPPGPMSSSSPGKTSRRPAATSSSPRRTYGKSSLQKGPSTEVPGCSCTISTSSPAAHGNRRRFRHAHRQDELPRHRPLPMVRPRKSRHGRERRRSRGLPCAREQGKRSEADRIARAVTHIELALEEGFQKEFIKALSIPYKES